MPSSFSRPFHGWAGAGLSRSRSCSAPTPMPRRGSSSAPGRRGGWTTWSGSSVSTRRRGASPRAPLARSLSGGSPRTSPTRGGPSASPGPPRRPTRRPGRRTSPSRATRASSARSPCFVRAAALSESMNASWARFAATGDPNGTGLAAWPAYDPARDLTLVWDDPASAVDGVRSEACDFWDSLLPGRGPRLLDAGRTRSLRCSSRGLRVRVDAEPIRRPKVLRRRAPARRGSGGTGGRGSRAGLRGDAGRLGPGPGPEGRGDAGAQPPRRRPLGPARGGARHPRRAARARPPGRAPPRHRQDGAPRRGPPQGGRARRGGAGPHAAPPRARLGDAQRHRLPAAGPGHPPLPPRALGRHRLSRAA